MERDPRIDAAIEQAAPFARPILRHLRELVHTALPGVGETIKWGMPHFMLGGKNIAGMAAFKAHTAFVIHGEGRQGDAMGQYGKIARLEDLPPDADLVAKLLAASERIASGTAARKPAATRAAKPELPMPPAFAAALDAAPAARATLAGFTAAQRREYVEWIAEARREDTRAKRITQAIEWLAEGKKRNWKYGKC